LLRAKLKKMTLNQQVRQRLKTIRLNKITTISKKDNILNDDTKLKFKLIDFLEKMNTGSKGVFKILCQPDIIIDIKG